MALLVTASLAIATVLAVEPLGWIAQPDQNWRGLLPAGVGDTLRNPRQMLADAADCMAHASRVTDCEALLLRVLRTNPRQTQAALWLAQIASFRGQESAAAQWVRHAGERDRSFAVQWAQWQQAQWHGSEWHGSEWYGGQPQSQPTREGEATRRHPQSARALLLVAPANQQAHFAGLLTAGWSAQQLFTILSAEGRPSQVHGLLEYLATAKPAQAALLVSAHARAATGSPTQPMDCRGLTLRIVAGALASRTGVAEAASLWRQMLLEPTPGCVAPEAPALPLKHTEATADPLWNYNPTLQFPLLPRSFDWSAVHRGQAAARPVGEGGAELPLPAPGEPPWILLARPLPPPLQARGLAVDTWWQREAAGSSPACSAALAWELRDGDGREVHARAPLQGLRRHSAQQGPAEEFAHAKAPMEDSRSTVRERVALTFSAWQPGMQLVLTASAPPKPCGPRTIILRRVTLTPLGQTDSEDAKPVQ
ncbi:MAG: hypothetical protein MUF01_14095 [Bryobacterales bacterium]|jgi:hypothetical protein|nr:hypothetical protein [Bryobacterales bacterium]